MIDDSRLTFVSCIHAAVQLERQCEFFEEADLAKGVELCEGS